MAKKSVAKSKAAASKASSGRAGRKRIPYKEPTVKTSFTMMTDAQSAFEKEAERQNLTVSYYISKVGLYIAEHGLNLEKGKSRKKSR